MIRFQPSQFGRAALILVLLAFVMVFLVGLRGGRLAEDSTARGRFKTGTRERDLGAIPRTFHASWKTKDLPPKFAEWRASTLGALPPPHWLHYLHTDAENRKLVVDHFPEHLALYDAFPVEIMRADIARLFYMSHYGGVYADLDVELLIEPGELEEALATQESHSRATIDSLGKKACRPGRVYHPLNATLEPETLKGGSKCRRDLVLALLGPPEILPFWPHAVPNAFMASVPGHPFWMYAVSQVERLYRERLEAVAKDLGVPVDDTSVKEPIFEKKLLESAPEYITGPGVLRESILNWILGHPDERAAGVVFLGPEVIFPYDWDHRHDLDDICSSQRTLFNRSACLEAVAVGRTSPIGRAFSQPKLVEARVRDMSNGLLKKATVEIVPVEIMETSGGSVLGTLAVSYWSHSWGNNPAVLQDS
jgi:hypothetical protein